MRIAVVANTSWYLVNFRLRLMKDLRADGHSVIAVAPRDAYTSKIIEEGFDFSEIGLSGKGANPFVEMVTVFRMLALFNRQRVDLVFSYTPKGNLYSAIAAIFLKLRFVPNVSGLGRVFISQSLLTTFVKILYRLTFRFAELVFFQNSDDRNIFLNLGIVSQDKSERLPGSGVDLDKFVPAPKAHDSKRVEFVFLLVARMLWDKGVGEYVEAARFLKVRYPNTRFLLLGGAGVDNPSAIPHQKIAEWVGAGLVDYYPHEDDVRPFLSRADCVVLPSYREGVPRTLLEAGAMAIPIVTTDAPGCRDTIIDGVTGYLCRPKDSRDLAEKMESVMCLSLPEKLQMGERGRRYIAEHFDENIVLKRYRDLALLLSQSV